MTNTIFMLNRELLMSFSELMDTFNGQDGLVAIVNIDVDIDVFVILFAFTLSR